MSGCRKDCAHAAALTGNPAAQVEGWDAVPQTNLGHLMWYKRICPSPQQTPGAAPCTESRERPAESYAK